MRTTSPNAGLRAKWCRNTSRLPRRAKSEWQMGIRGGRWWFCPITTRLYCDKTRNARLGFVNWVFWGFRQNFKSIFICFLSQFIKTPPGSLVRRNFSFIKPTSVYVSEKVIAWLYRFIHIGSIDTWLLLYRSILSVDYCKSDYCGKNKNQLFFKIYFHILLRIS